MKDKDENQAGSVQITFYTDPLCCWSWAFEPQWRRLRYEYAGSIKWRYRMGGLIPSWEAYNDPMNAVSKPVQMGPLWMEARYTTGMPIDDKVWFNNPPDSSFPACIAVKAAGLQGADAAERYLRLVREAVMLHGQDIADWEVLARVARELSESEPELLDYAAFKEAASGEEAKKAFEEDLLQVRLHNISRFPTLTLNKPGQPGVMIVGYRPYEALVTALRQVAPELEPTRKATDAESYRSFWGSATDREVQEALGQAAPLQKQP